MRSVAAVAFAFVASFACTACGEPEPACGEVALGELSTEVVDGELVFDWTGQAAHLSVTDVRTAAAQWEVRCNCLAEERNPDRNSGCAESADEFAFRHCLSGPVLYGETLPIDTLLAPGDFDAAGTALEPAELTPGREYEVRVDVFCAGGTRSRQQRFVAP